MTRNNILTKIKQRYSAPYPDEIYDFSYIGVVSLRRLSLEIGLSLIAAVIIERILATVLLYLAVAVFGRPFFQETTLGNTIVIYVINAVAVYAPKIVIFSGLYKKYRTFTKFYPRYNNKLIYPFLFVPLVFAMGMWGSQVTRLINLILQYLFGAGEIESVMDAIAPSGFDTGMVALISSCIIAPVAEEYIYRRLIITPLRAYGDTAAIVVSALIFGLAHGNFDQFAYSFFSGIIFGLVAVRYNSIKPGIILHVMNNLLVSMITYEDLLKSGVPIIDGIIGFLANLGNLVVYFSYFGGVVLVLIGVFTGMFTPVKYPVIDKRERRRRFATLVSLPMILAAAVMLWGF